MSDGPKAFGSVTIGSTGDALSETTKFCGAVFGPSGVGKTTFAATLDEMTRQFDGKPSLYVACEGSDGGGTLSVADKNIAMVHVKTMLDMESVLSGLASDTYYGGVMVDNASDYVKNILQPYALKFPSKEKTAQRDAGVPERGDYQIMGEKLREQLNRLMNLTTTTKLGPDGKQVPDMARRKHLIVVCLERTKMTPDGKKIVSIGPDLPGAMSDNASALFQVVAEMKVREQMVPGVAGQAATRQMIRYLDTVNDGVRLIKDRTRVLPPQCEPNMVTIWEKYWLPEVERRKKEREGNAS